MFFARRAGVVMPSSSPGGHRSGCRAQARHTRAWLPAR